MADTGIMPYEDRSRFYHIRRQRFVNDLDMIAEQLYHGRITLGWWEEDMRTRMRMYMVGSASIGRGGHNQMTSSDWGKVGAELKKQYRWLHGFAQDIHERSDDISLDAIKARAHLYANAGSKIANRMMAGPLESMLKWLPGDGSTTCLNSCGCRWMLSVLSHNEISRMVTVEAVWEMDHGKEHCEPRGGLDGCAQRDGHTEIITVPEGTEIPPYIGVA